MPSKSVKEVNLTPGTNCTICLGDFNLDQNVRNLLCGHTFHTDCIDSWCEKNLNCPVCRFDLDEESI